MEKLYSNITFSVSSREYILHTDGNIDVTLLYKICIFYRFFSFLSLILRGCVLTTNDGMHRTLNFGGCCLAFTSPKYMPPRRITYNT